MRKLGIALLVLFVLVIAAALAAPYFLDVNRYHGRVQAEVQKRLGRPVSLGAMRLSILPLAFRVENAVIGEDQAFKAGKPFAQAGELYVSARLMPLLRGEMEVSSLELKGPRIEIIRSQQGTWNFASLGHASPGPKVETSASAGGTAANQNGPPTGGAEASKPAEPQHQFSLAELKVTDGQLAITDWHQRQGRAVYDHIDLTLKDYAPGKPFAIEAAAHLPGAGAQRLEITGRGGPVGQGSLAGVPFGGSIFLDQVSVSGLQRFLNSPVLAGTEAIASGKADLKNEHGKLESSGSLKLENGRIRGVEIGYPVALDYSLADDLSNDVIRIAKADLNLGATPVSLIGTINLRPTPAQLDVKATATNASIAQMARLASAFGVVFDPAMQIAGRITADVQARGAATRPALNGSLKASDLVITGKELPEAVKVPAVELALSPEVIKSNDFAAATGATTVTANFALSNYQSSSSTVNAGLRAQDAKLGELLNIARAYGIAAVEGMSGAGTVSLDLHLQGPTKDPGAMTYSGAGLLQNASLKVPSLTKPLQIKNAILHFAQNAAVLDQVALSVGQTNATGSLTVRNFTTPNVEFALSADKFDVGEWQQMVTSPPQRSAAAQIVPSAYAAAPAQENFLAKMTGGGTVKVGSVIYDQLLLTDAQATVALARGVIRLEPVRAKLYGGEENGAIVVNTRTTPPTCTVTSTLDRVDANQLLSATSSLKRTLYGLLAANTSSSFTATSADSIARSLNGELSLDLKNGKLANIDLLYELANIGKFLSGGQAAKPFTNLVQLAGNFKVLNGVAHTDNLKAVIEGGTLAAVGDVNLADQSVKMRLTAVLSKVFSDRVGGTGIGGYMSTALANNKGELVLPVIVSGSLQKPRLAPDLQAMGQMKLQNLLPSTSNPAGLTTGILGSIRGKQEQPAAGQSPAQKGGVEGVLDLLKGNKQPKPQGNQGQGVAAPGTEQPQPSNAEPKNPVSDLLNSVLQQQKKKEQQQKPKENQPPPEPPKL